MFVYTTFNHIKYCGKPIEYINFKLGIFKINKYIDYVQ